MLTAPEYLGEYTFADAMVRGWGLVINCRTCARLVTLNDAELLRRFAKVAFEPMSRLIMKAHCEQCGNRAPLIYAYNSGVSIVWDETGKAISDEPARIASRTEQLREWAALKKEQSPSLPINNYTEAKKR